MVSLRNGSRGFNSFSFTARDLIAPTSLLYLHRVQNLSTSNSIIWEHHNLLCIVFSFLNMILFDNLDLSNVILCLPWYEINFFEQFFLMKLEFSNHFSSCSVKPRGKHAPFVNGAITNYPDIKVYGLLIKLLPPLCYVRDIIKIEESFVRSCS